MRRPLRLTASKSQRQARTGIRNGLPLQERHPRKDAPQGPK